MGNQTKRHLVTAALPYANGPLHIGHIAGAYLPSDIYARFLRMKGEEVVFVCGSDEHGAAITLRAKKEGITPQEIVDKYHGINKTAFEEFGITFDIYHRTSSQLHHQAAQDFFIELEKKNCFTVEESEQFYDEEYKQFLADRYIIGTCPKCNFENAYGDQCEKCGSSLNPTDLINPKSTLSGKAPILKTTKHWYLPMQNHETWLKEWIQEGTLEGLPHHNPKKWRRHVVGQCMSWLDGGLGPRAMTRDLDWGVKVPTENAEGKVLYVWLDAPIGYISATKAWAEASGKDWKDYWQNEETAITHFIAKDNIVFHCIIFPILLKAHGGYNLPVNVPANEFLNLEGDKISTSREWAVWLHEYLEDFPGKKDELRYVLTSISPENKDSEFTWSGYQERVNNELVAVLGNFVNRALVLTHKYFEGRVPSAGSLGEKEQELLEVIGRIPSQLDMQISNHRYKEALIEAMQLARMGNKYLADTEPWKLIKTDENRVKSILNFALQITANAAIALEPFLPKATAKMKQFLNREDLAWQHLGNLNNLVDGHELQKPELLFKKIEDVDIERQKEKLEATKKAKAVKVEPQKDETSFELFSQMDIRVGEIIEAKKVKKADKLLELKVDTGIDTRTIVSGIAKHFKPEEILGKKVSVLVNLAPRKLRGVESQGMILMAEDHEGKLTFVSVEGDSKPGDVIR
jgi:methionyl-tRNA synthetase